MAISIPVIFPGSQALPTGLPIFPDASMREEHGVTYVVSSVPVEGGAQITNHVQRQPTPLVMDVVFTDTPDAFVVPRSNRSKALYEELLALFDRREPFEIWTSLRAYLSMVATSVSTPRSAETGNALVITVVLQQIEIALVDMLQVLADAALALALGAQDVGSLTPSIDSAVEGAGAVA